MFRLLGRSYRLTQAELDVPGTAARLFAEVQAAYEGVSFKEKTIGHAAGPLRAFHVSMLFLAKLDLAQPPALRLVATHAWTLDHHKWQKVEPEELQVSLSGQESVFSVLARLCSAQGLRLTTIGSTLRVGVAG